MDTNLKHQKESRFAITNKLAKLLFYLAFAILMQFSFEAGAQGPPPGQWQGSTISTTTPNSLGVGTLLPAGWQEINYCNDNENGLVITKYDCGIWTLDVNDITNPSLDGKIIQFEPTGGTPPSGGPVLFTPPLNFMLTPYNSSLAKPMIWARMENDPKFGSNRSGLHTTRLIVTPYGRSGFNIENPRATVDIKSLGPYNTPAMIVGRQQIGTIDRTQHMHFVPLLAENGYNQITQNGDQGIFFTDGMGKLGANQNGTFVLAPWASDRDPLIGGLRIDKMGNVDVHGELTATKVSVLPVWWSDFVFRSDYQLMPVLDIEPFIKDCGHLPGMPSEQQILEEGMDVGDMLGLQQMKIEELTLYTIEQEKKINALEKKIELLSTLFESQK